MKAKGRAHPELTHEIRSKSIVKSDAKRFQLVPSEAFTSNCSLTVQLNEKISMVALRFFSYSIGRHCVRWGKGEPCCPQPVNYCKLGDAEQSSHKLT